MEWTLEETPAPEEVMMEYGQIVATRGVADRMERDPAFRRDLAVAFFRYQLACALNRARARAGERTRAAYTCAGSNIWIITEWDRSYTTFLFPDEY